MRRIQHPMSFKNFIYYCALCGGWAAFITWAIQEFTRIQYIENRLVQATIIGSLLGLLLALVVGTLDAMLNSVSFQRIIRVVICVGVGLHHCRLDDRWHCHRCLHRRL
jgi:hypothetical protein